MKNGEPGFNIKSDYWIIISLYKTSSKASSNWLFWIPPTNKYCWKEFTILNTHIHYTIKYTWTLRTMIINVEGIFFEGSQNVTNRRSRWVEFRLKVKGILRCYVIAIFLDKERRTNRRLALALLPSLSLALILEKKGKAASSIFSTRDTFSQLPSFNILKDSINLNSENKFKLCNVCSALKLY